MSEPRVRNKPPRRRAAGLYDPSYEHDGCGVACVARLDGEPRHDVIDLALTALDDLEHRGAAGADPSTGDGAGVLIQLPHAFLRSRVGEFGITRAQLPDPGSVAVASCFLSSDPTLWESQQRLIEHAVIAAGQLPLGWRQVPVDLAGCGETARDVAPEFRQLLVGAGPEVVDQDEFERRLFVARRIAELEAGSELSIPSFSSRTLVYKGMLTAPQLSRFYADLRDPELQSALAVVHSRFSTNTFPSWELAQPLRLLAHNGEINTLAGNFNWMRAREAALHSNLFGQDLERCLPLIPDGSSDSAAFDRVLELLTLAGRPLRAGDDDDDPGRLRRPRRHAARARGLLPLQLLGDRALGRTGGDGLLRRARCSAPASTATGCAPGAGWSPTRAWSCSAPRPACCRWTRRRWSGAGACIPGGCSSSTSSASCCRPTARPSSRSRARKPYGNWCDQGEIRIDDLAERTPPRTHEPLRTRQLAFGYSQEDLRVLIAPAAEAGIEPTGSMGNDLALAALSELRAVAVQLLQAALRPGHQPADRLGARVDRDEPGDADRLRGQHALRGARARDPAGPRPPGAHQRRARTRRPRLAPGAARDDARRHLAARRRARRDSRRRSTGSPARPAPRSPARRT